MIVIILGLIGLVVGGLCFYQIKDKPAVKLRILKLKKKFFPKDPSLYVEMADMLSEREPYQQAFAVYREAALLRGQGELLDLEKIKPAYQKAAQVIKLYDKALELNQKYIPAYVGVGKIYELTAQFPAAFNIYLKAIKIDPYQADIHFKLAQMYHQVKDQKQAIYALNQVLKLFPDNENMLVRVVSEFNQFLKQNPESEEYRVAHREALELYTKFVNSRPANAVSLFNLASLLYEAGDGERALSAFRMSLDLNPRYAPTLYNLGNLYKNSGRFQEALEMYDQAIKQDSNLVDAWINSGVIWLKMGDVNKAEQSFEKAVTLDSAHAGSWFNLGYLQESSGKLREAATSYEKAAYLDARNPEPYYNLGNVQVKLDQYDLAKISFQKTLHINPNHVNAAVNLCLLDFQMEYYQESVKTCDEAVLLGFEMSDNMKNVLSPYK